MGKFTKAMALFSSVLWVTFLISAFSFAPVLRGYRRPNLVYNSASVVNIETGLTGISGQAAMMFPDGSYYVESTAANIQCDITKRANWGNGTMQAGFRPTETVAANTWLAAYAVKSTATLNFTDFVVVVSTWLPTQANYTTLNTNFCGSGSGCYTYLGLVAYGDRAANSTTIFPFTQNGNYTRLYGAFGGGNQQWSGIRLVSCSGVATCSWGYTVGTSSVAIPSNVNQGDIIIETTVGAAVHSIVRDAASTYFKWEVGATTGLNIYAFRTYLGDGIQHSNSASENEAVVLGLDAWVDNALGIGSNPFL